MSSFPQEMPCQYEVAGARCPCLHPHTVQQATEGSREGQESAAAGGRYVFQRIRLSRIRPLKRTSWILND